VTIAEEPRECLRRLVRERAGLAVEGGRAQLFDAALARAARAAGEDPAAHAGRICAGDAPLQAFLEELAVGETYFFRDPAQWQFVEQVVLPAVARRGPGEGLRAWSAGCASGEEPYTLAILLEEAGLGGGRSRVVATDLSEAALARARRAEYSLWSLRGEGAWRARRHLREQGGRFRLDETIARTVKFARLNLAEAGYPSAARGLADLDLVLCRNVLIYVDAGHLAPIARRLYESLAPGGWLITGASDPSVAAHAGFEPRTGPHGTAWRRPPLRGEAGRRAAPRAVRPAARALVRPAARAARRAATPPPAAAAPVDPDCADCRALLDAGRLPEALSAVDAALGRTPLRADLHLLRAIAMSELGRLDEAEASTRRAQYLARDEPFIPFFLALVRLQRGAGAAAARDLERVLALCARRGPDEQVPLSEGITVAGLAAAARHHLERARGDGRAAPGP
jgi:chemotaxis protein methyltransferase CheR